MTKYDEIAEILLIMFDKQCSREDFAKYVLSTCEDIHNDFLSLEESYIELAETTGTYYHMYNELKAKHNETRDI